MKISIPAASRDVAATAYLRGHRINIGPWQTKTLFIKLWAVTLSPQAHTS